MIIEFIAIIGSIGLYTVSFFRFYLDYPKKVIKRPPTLGQTAVRAIFFIVANIFLFGSFYIGSATFGVLTQMIFEFLLYAPTESFKLVLNILLILGGFLFLVLLAIFKGKAILEYAGLD